MNVTNREKMGLQSNRALFAQYVANPIFDRFKSSIDCFDRDRKSTTVNLGDVYAESNVASLEISNPISLESPRLPSQAAKHPASS